MHTTAEPAAAGQAAHAAHALDAAASPLVRALPQYERGFRDHLAEAAALAAAGQQRLAAAVRLANEMEVQVRPRARVPYPTLAASPGMSVVVWRLMSTVPCLFSVVPVVANGGIALCCYFS